MKHVFTFFAWLVLICRLGTAAQAQTWALPFTPQLTTRALPFTPQLSVTAPTRAASSRSAQQRAPAASTIRYVKAGATGTGASWSNASSDVQAMINASVTGDQVWIAGGIYKPNTTGLSNARTAAFSLKNGVRVLGGYTGAAGTEGNADSRTAQPSSTTLSGDIGTADDNSDNSYHVVANINNGLDNSAVLDGVAIVGGNADGPVTNTDNLNAFGGGMINYTSAPSILNCQFISNNTTRIGALDTYGATGLRVINCFFSDNTGGQVAAIYDDRNTNSVYANCYFKHNINPFGLPAFLASGNTATLTNCTFRENSGSVGYRNATLNLVNCLLWSNYRQFGVYREEGTLNVSYSLLEPFIAYTDKGNNKTLDREPFANDNGPALEACSPAVDAGSNAANSTTTDVLGNTRKVRQIDIGAAEYQGAAYIPPTLATLPQSATTVCAETVVRFKVSQSYGTEGASTDLYRDNTLVSTVFQGGPFSPLSEYTFSQPITQSGSYQLVLTTTSGCRILTTTYAPITVNPLPTAYSVTGGGAYCQGSNGVAVGLAGSQTGVNYQLRRDGTNVSSPVAGTGSALSFGTQTSAGTYTVLATNTSTGCQQPMNGSATVSITPLPSAPTLVTQSGYPYPAGVSSLTLSQNVGLVSLTAVGCSDGQLTANGSTVSSFTISTASTGTQTYTATCTQTGCTGLAGSFQLAVVPTTLSVQHRDADYGNTQNNIIKPFLQLANAGGQAIPYGDITVRYWFTSEGQASPTNLAVYYAPLGAVSMKYVPLAQPRQGAFGYVEYSFPAGGNLAGGANSGPIENGIQKTDGSAFNESDDYSYAANYQSYVPNNRVTAYRNGTIVWGQEPTTVQSQPAVAVYSAAKDGTTTSQIQTRLELRNTGNTALAVGSLKLRYYFTSDNNQPANVYVDYADIGAAKVAARVVKLPAPVEGADSYVELSFPNNTMLVNALSSLGAIDFRLVRSDNGLFNQSNDYSYAANYGNVGLNVKVTAYLDNRLLFGTPPSGAPARLGASEPGTELSVKVLGNPVVGDQAQLLITGVAGQAVNLRLVDLQGHPIHEQRIHQAAETESVNVPLGQSRGQLLLRVSTDTQQQNLKLVRP